jgi:DNA-binding NarL/FixJ family response regulator
VMAVRRVFILWTHPLFHETVRVLLNHPEVEWIGSSPDSIPEDLLLQTPPDIIVLEEEGGGPTVEIINLLMTHRESVRVLGLNLLDNQMSVFDYSHRTVCKADDLLYWVLEDCTQKENSE